MSDSLGTITKSFLSFDHFNLTFYRLYKLLYFENGYFKWTTLFPGPFLAKDP